MKYPAWFFTIGLIALTAPGYAADFILQSSTQPIVVDARLDDEAWQNAERLPLNYETKPGNNTKPIVATEAMMLEHNNTLYIAFKAYDPQPEKIRAFLRDRDNGPDDDKVLITIDTFNSGQIAYSFTVNALGVQTDKVRNEANDEDSTSWDATWDSAGRITDFGYLVEMAIPLNALRFPDRDRQQWRINLERSYPREQAYRYALNPKDRNNSCVICQFSMLQGLEGAKPSANLELSPSLVYSQSQARDFDTPWPSADKDSELGLDMRWGITPNISLNATINPDFSQIEADAAQLNINDQFDSGLEEKRSFFLEGSDYFETNKALVYTRNIVDPNYGLKLTGKEGRHTMGIMVVEDNQTKIILPSHDSSSTETLTDGNKPVASLSTIARYQYQLDNGLSLGTLLTNRQASNGDYENTVLSIDGFWQINDSDRLYTQSVQSKTDYPISFQTQYDQEDHIEDSAHFIRYEHATDNWNYSLHFQEFGKDFRADSGFIPQVAYNKYKAKGGYIWHADNPWWSQLELEFDWDISHDDSGNVIERGFETAIKIEAIGQSKIKIKTGNHNKIYGAASYPGHFYALKVNTKPYAGIDLSAELEWADTVDTDNERPGEEQKMELIAGINIGQHLLLEITWEREQLEVTGGRLFTAEAQDIRINYQFTNNSRLRLSLINEKVNKDTQLYLNPYNEDAKEREKSYQLIYSYKLNPQSVFFMGYGENVYSNDETEQWFSDEKTFFIKISHAWLN